MTLLCGINTDDDVAGVMLTPSTGSTTEGKMEPAVFAVKLQTKPSSAVVVSSTLVGDDKTEVGPFTVEKEITPDQWNQVQRFQVPLFSSTVGFLLGLVCNNFQTVHNHLFRHSCHDLSSLRLTTTLMTATKKCGCNSVCVPKMICTMAPLAACLLPTRMMIAAS